MTGDVYGPSIGVYHVERAFEATLTAWLPDHLAHVERTEGLSSGALPMPKSWATISELTFKENELPAIVVVSPGAGAPPTHAAGVYDATWQIDVVVVTAAAKERDARAAAALTLQAVRDTIVHQPTLDGTVSHTWWAGGDNHTAGRPRQMTGQRAVYSTSFLVTARKVVDQRAHPASPSLDPHSPPAAPESPLTAEITVTSTRPGATP